jgi:ubiquinone/menaquinone biosynthesis C-methylase UbiE
MNKNVETVIEYYEGYNEDSRMKDNPIEYLRCKEIISRHLHKESMRILDIGGATGAFSFWLAQFGHKVSLIDFTPKHIEIAKVHQQESESLLDSICVGDARELPYENNSFDLVLLMGPLYHLVDRIDRIKAICEAYRVLKPNGIIVCEVISRYASMVDGFNYGFVNDMEFVSIMNKDIKTGLHEDTSQSKKYFTKAYFHQSGEVSLELEESGFCFKELIAVESFASTIHDIDNKIKDEYYREVLLSTIREVEKDETLMGISNHYMGIGIKQ